MELILASSSPYRQALLRQAGIPFRAVAPHVDETAIAQAATAQGAAHDQVCRALATAKAQAVASRHPADIVVGCDQLLSIDGEILGKPGTPDGARAQLRRLSGRTHELITAFAVMAPNRVLVEAISSRMTMRSLTDAEISRYVTVDEPWDCAGSYKWECRGIALFERIETPDHTAIVGLPIIGLITALRRCGVNVL